MLSFVEVVVAVTVVVMVERGLILGGGLLSLSQWIRTRI